VTRSGPAHAIVTVAVVAGCAQSSTPPSQPTQVVPALQAASADPEPEAVPALPPRRLAAGTFATCAVTNARRVMCWGASQVETLGMGGEAEHGPIEVPGLDQVVEIAGAQDEMCARRTNNEVLCWGPGRKPNHVPLLVEDPDHIAGCAIGCAVGAGGDGSCWGPQGTFGQPATDAPWRLHAAKAPFGGIGQVACSFYSVTWWLLDGRLLGWNGGEPKKLGDVDGVAALVHGNSASVCALRGAGDILCFDQEAAPEPAAAGLPPARDVALGLGWRCSLARDVDGQIDCWSDEGSREPSCGDFDFGESTTICTGPGPTPQLGLKSGTATVAAHIPGAVELVGGGYHLCARTRAGAVYCWGDNSYGNSLPAPDAPLWLPEPVLALDLSR
jgi:hypothetical protein